MVSTAKYKLLGVDADGKYHEREVSGAPHDAYLAKWARMRKLVFVARYFPSRKGWVIWDARKLDIVLHTSRSGNTYQQVVGFTRLRTIYPTEDAVVMKLYHMRNPPEQTEFKL